MKFLYTCLALLLISNVSFADQIEWEITNRFSPFETFQDTASDVFNKYKFIETDHKSALVWYSRLWERDGLSFASPYAAALKNKQPHLLPWDAQTQRHRNAVTNFVKGSEAKIRTRYKIDWPGKCKWNIGTENFEHACRVWTPVFRIPIKGLKVSVSNSEKSITQYQISPKHKVIVAFGDSYGSGEGNPDLPVKWKKWGTEIEAPVDNSSHWLTQTKYVKQKTAWLDQRCHRSFFSSQTLTALAIASENPHRFVSFLHYACSGAEIMDGLLVRQYEPGGAIKKETYNKYSQINLAIKELCSKSPSDDQQFEDYPFYQIELSNKKPINASFKDKRVYEKDKTVKDVADFSKEPIFQCNETDFTKPDLILLSIGGNDVGFSNLVQYHISPLDFRTTFVANLAYPVVCPEQEFHTFSSSNQRDEFCKEQHEVVGADIGDLIEMLQLKLELAGELFEKYLKAPRDKIVLNQYPDPLRMDMISRNQGNYSNHEYDCRGDGEFYGECLSQRYTGPWEAFRSKVPFFSWPPNWDFNLAGYHRDNIEHDFRVSEVFRMLGQIDAFRSELDFSAQCVGFQFVCDIKDAFVNHGWQEGKNRNLPNTYDKERNIFGKKYNDRHYHQKWDITKWHPYAYNPYDRMVRTGNDSFLTQASWIDGGEHGTAHPNLLGHAKIADMMLQKIEEKKLLKE